ncbi:MAG: AAA family ATPase, partial [Vallitaleaceae bacterium]|nr:AAA family ATPase [Vallitaleaceae bacterium]
MNNERLIVIPIEGTVIFPKSTTKLAVDKKYGDYLYQLMNDETVSAIALSKRPNSDGDKSDDFYAIGVILELNSIKTTADGYLVKVVAKDKVQVNQMEFTKKYITAISDELYEEIDLDDIGHRAMLEFVTKLIHELGERFPGSDSFLKRIDELRTVDQILGEIAPYINISMNDKQQLMELNSVRKRGMQAIEILRKQKDAIDLQIEMAKRYSNKINKTYREQLLREQMKAIQEELSDDDDDGKVDYRKNIEAAGMPADVKKVALSELRKLEGNSQNNAESNIIRNYLELLLDLPWKAPEVTEVNLDKARTILREQHYGLDEVKTRIIQHLAVMKLKKEKQGSILLLVGPPGTGKTSLGKSIAEALGREYIRISLGGVRDESEIRGHRKTYIGAMPGRIIGGMKNAGTTNPVFILDEIDKLSSSYNGDPASALLEVLDPEQNNSFADHYLNVPYDLSNVFFVATANNVSSIPGPLRDRMEIIEISSYTNKEKLEIGKRHLLPQVLEEHGLTRKELQLTPKAFEAVINQYTRE